MPPLLPIALALSLTAEPGPSDDLATVARSLRADQRERVEKALGGLESLPIYRIEATVDPKHRQVEGQEQIVVPAGSAPLTSIEIRIFENAPQFERTPVISIRESVVNGIPEKPVSDSAAILRFPVDPPVPPGKSATLTLRFHVDVPTLDDSMLTLEASIGSALAAFNNPGSMRGLAPPDRGVLGATSRILNLGAFFPALAPRGSAGGRGGKEAFRYPWVDPSNFVVSFVAPESYRVACAGIVVGRTPAASGKTRTTAVAAAVRDFAAFLSPDFVEETRAVGGVTVKGFSLKQEKSNRVAILEAAGKALSFYQNRFGPYPWAELKIVQSPMPFNKDGVAHPTIVGISSTLFQIEDSGAAGSQEMEASRQMVRAVVDGAVGHNLAHQWWGAVVGSNAEEDASIEEPLAQYSSVLFVEHLHGRKIADRFAEMIFTRRYRAYRRSGSDQVVERPLREFKSGREFDAVVGCKAPRFYGAARQLLGDTLFFRALATYADGRFFGTAKPDDFTIAAGVVAPGKGEALSALRQHWFREVHGDEDLGGPSKKRPNREALRRYAPLLERLMRNAEDPEHAEPLTVPDGGVVRFGASLKPPTASEEP